MWWSPIEYLTHGSKPSVKQVMTNRLQKGLGDSRISMDSELGQRIVPEEPGPDRPLMVCPISLPNTPSVVRTVVAVGRREGPQSEGAKQVALTDGDNLLLRFRAEWAMGQAHRQYLIRTNGVVVAFRTVDYIKKTSRLFIDELREASFNLFCKLIISCG